MFVKEFSKQKRDEDVLKWKLINNCNRFLSGHFEKSTSETLFEIAEFAQSHPNPDHYGMGEFLNAFEEEIAALLGVEEAIFMPSGVMSQSIALRIWAERSHNRNVAFHATSHLEVNEQRAYAALHGLNATLLGDKHSPFTAQHILQSPEKLSSVLLELPYRRLGGILPTWEELTAIKSAAKAKSIRLHMDGARLWESQPFYSRPFAEICKGFDSVYVSFYKGIGALTGSMLLGPADFIQEARLWQRRQGGNLYQLYPYVLSAKQCFDRRKNLFVKYHERALSLSAALAAVPGLTLRIENPHTSLMHVYLPVGVQVLSGRRDQIAREDRIWLGGSFFESDAPNTSLMEISVGDATLTLSNEEIVDAVKKLIS